MRRALRLYRVVTLRGGSHSAEFNPVFLLLAVPLLAAGVAMVYTLKSRIQEERIGEEDDPGNY